MKTSAVQLISHLGADSRRGVEGVAQMVQELLHVAAEANHRTGAMYLPETFLTRW